MATPPATDPQTDTAPELPPIVQTGHPVLRTPAPLVTPEELASPGFRELVATMVAVMRAAPGVGLAAPQIGVARQILVAEDREELISYLPEEDRARKERTPLPLTVIVNPVLRLVEGPRATFFEGCLSVTGYAALVPRALEVEVTGLDATGETPVRRTWHLRGWPARILQHEIDHLQGTLYVDRMHSRSLCGPDEIRRWTGKTTAEVAAGLGVKIEM